MLGSDPGWAGFGLLMWTRTQPEVQGSGRNLASASVCGSNVVGGRPGQSLLWTWCSDEGVVCCLFRGPGKGKGLFWGGGWACFEMWGF